MNATNKISGLKAGDQVAVRGGYSPYRLHTVSKITPAGQVVLDNGTRFKDGCEMGASGWSKDYLYPVTPEILKDIKRRSLRSQISAMLDNRVIDNMSMEGMEEVLAVLKKHTEQGE